AKWGITCGEKKGIAVMGFSAGGHLASTLATCHDKFTRAEDDLADAVSARPDCAVLCYPVIDMSGRFGHTGSRKNLLGENPSEDLANLLSADKQVNSNCPPTFLWHTADDGSVSMENSLAFAQS